MQLHETSDTEEDIHNIASFIYSIIERMIDMAGLERIKYIVNDLVDQDYHEASLMGPVKLSNFIHTNRVKLIDPISLKVINTVSIELAYIPRHRAVEAGYHGITNTIVVNILNFFGPTHRTPEDIWSAIVHELRHAYDNILSAGDTELPGAALKNPVDPDISYKKYLALPPEINARFSQAVAAINEYLSNRVGLGGVVATQDAISLTNYFLKQYQIDRVFPNRTASPRYRRLARRVLDFINTRYQVSNTATPHVKVRNEQ